MKCIITGGAGFIGSHLTDKLVNEGFDTAVIDDLSTGEEKNINKASRFYQADICGEEIGGIFEKERPDMVFHLAAHINVRRSVKDPITDARINILGSLNVIENFLRWRPSPQSKFIFMSTGGAIYGDAATIPTSENCDPAPVSPYGVAKLAVEKYLNYYHQTGSLSRVIMRPPNVYGPRQNYHAEAGVVAFFCNRMLAGIGPAISGDGRQTRDFIYVEDVVAALLLAARRGDGVYNVGTGIETDINRIFELVAKACGKPCDKKYGAALAGEQKRSCLDSSKIRIELGWEPKVGIEEGIGRTAGYFMSLDN
ncbi:MAG: NAD-dependent epimerase/dehydratase family protein [Candidatus Pacebacteria bacterium]|nr:NAD-dependent epimerase/dehydratase family protein [Candidatus Paceibacterota bacterium]